jgi:hypothetical protein
VIAELGLAKIAMSKVCSTRAGECLHAVKENVKEVQVSTACQHKHIGKELAW